jgi:hypothetical protein
LAATIFCRCRIVGPDEAGGSAIHQVKTIQFPGAFASMASYMLIKFDIQVTDWHNCGFCLEGFPSGQRDQTVNLTVLPSKVRILPPPPIVFDFGFNVCGRLVLLAEWQQLF